MDGSIWFLAASRQKLWCPGMALPGRAYVFWRNEMAEQEALVSAWALHLGVVTTEWPASIVDPVPVEPPNEVAAAILGAAPYRVFVCNRKKWAIDRFLDRGTEHDSWGVRAPHRRRIAPSQTRRAHRRTGQRR